MAGDTTRPITDRAKVALFNILGDWIMETRVLDLFAGTGGVGVEALSRGASHVTFIDKSHEATRTIGENLRLTGLAHSAWVRRTDAFRFLGQPPTEPYDLIYVAPPQYNGLWSKALLMLDEHLAEWLLPDGAIVAQIHPVEYEALALQNLVLYDERRYGSTLLCFYENKE